MKQVVLSFLWVIFGTLSLNCLAFQDQPKDRSSDGSLPVSSGQPLSSAEGEERGCQDDIDIFMVNNPPVIYLGDPEKEDWPNPQLLERKIARAKELWSIPVDWDTHAELDICVQQVREACWDYCIAGIEPGALDLYCISRACVDQ